MPAGTANRIEQKGGDGELDRIWITRRDQVQNGIIEANRSAKVAVEDVTPVMKILGAQGQVEAVL